MSECVNQIWVKYWYMGSVMIKLKMNKVATQYYYSITLTARCMKLKRKMYMKILVRIKKCLILATILLMQNIMMIQLN